VCAVEKICHALWRGREGLGRAGHEANAKNQHWLKISHFWSFIDLQIFDGGRQNNFKFSLANNNEGKKF
jgi:hypothetical protein